MHYVSPPYLHLLMLGITSIGAIGPYELPDRMLWEGHNKMYWKHFT